MEAHATRSPCATPTTAATATGTAASAVGSASAVIGAANTIPAALTTQTTTLPNVINPTNSCPNNPIASSINNNNSGTGSGNTAATPVSSACLPTNLVAHIQQTPLSQLLTTAIDAAKQEEINNLSLASGISEGQRSHSGAPSASSSPILSPQGKIFGRNANGTMVATSRPNNEAEIQLYRVLQRASLLAYYDTLLEMGGDDVQQLYDAGEEEFLEIMALVGMASKPLHVRRLQKALHEWANNPSLFQGPMMSNISGLCETPPKSVMTFNTEATPAVPRNKFPSFTASAAFHPTPLLHTAHTSPAPSCSTSASSQLLTQICTPTVSVPAIPPHTPLAHSNPLPLATNNPLQVVPQPSASGSTSHQVTSSSPQLTPVLTELQVQRITLGAEKIARELPQREPRAQTSKKRATRELEQVIAMSENDPRRLDEIRKYSAIYGRFDCKRRPEKPLTLHEVCVNEAAAQLCRLVPALLTRRDELFPLARQIVKDAGFGHSASIARYGGLLSQMQTQNVARSNVMLDCESSDSSLAPIKRQRLCSTETSSAPVDPNREILEDSRYNLFAMYQKFAKPPFDLSEIAKFSLNRSEFEDNIDNDSRFSFSNSSSPPMPANGKENDRDGSIAMDGHTVILATSHVSTSQQQNQQRIVHNPSSPNDKVEITESVDLSTSSALSGVQVISAAGGNIIAVANPALALSPTLNEVLTLKRDVGSPEVQ